MRLKITQYGLSVKAGGWDGAGDSGTDAWIGCHGNLLNFSSCALSRSAEQLLVDAGLKPGGLLKIVFDAKHVYYRTWDDRTDQALPDGRVDLFNPFAEDRNIPGDTAEVTLVS